MDKPCGLEGSSAFRRSGSKGSEGSEGGGIALTGDEYEISVTGLALCVIWHDKHSADWLAALASPYPASPDFPLFRGKNKALKSSPFISSLQHNGAL